MQTPLELCAGLSGPERRVVALWWAQLDEDARHELLRAWGRPASLREEGADAGLTIELHGVWVGEDEAETRRELAEWQREYFEFLLNYPGLEWPAGPRLHLCRAHPRARAAVRRGVIPADFACPFAARACPMRAAARAGGVRLEPRVRLSRAGVQGPAEEGAACPR